jgi:hypothetical protein
MPSVTLRDVASAAAQYLGVLDSGETLSAQQEADALEAVNNMLESWVNEQVQMIRLVLQTFTLAGGTYTPAAVLQFANATTPLVIPAGYVRAIQLAAAIELAPQYDMQPSPALVKTYTEARAAATPLLATVLAGAPQANKSSG